MIDLHTHTLFSDGELIPAEHIRRAIMHGYRAIAMTDHADFTNFEYIISSLQKAKVIEEEWEIDIFAGIEITHVPPGQINKLAKRAKEIGADIVVVHGETPVEPVAAGTNRAAIESEFVDILAHPGFITAEETELAKMTNTYLEITARGGHNRTNGHVAKLASGIGAKLVCNTDTHHPKDMITKETAYDVLTGAGLSKEQADQAFKNSEELVEKMKQKR
ncbi:DNA polymerase/3'-5' exonuclease PolX [Methanimicrococcus sp. At1]|uniref:DNA polymerase/3'-5' exonuclease PolX n=1 Tax=Methanimicrococcus hacksteinii TaxID=3028293 RepID=A0ABU3VQB9_9EURY|nr:histidinol phosphate phosphatase domain-containing protein [Methanimicrococcus sp. At1]MDV0445619.1 DNA polymerase/3'-5' exonuclease PolX [Methanimicrococcus sp. At1]